ncbi:MAG TPA: right-handed parallel beta-helix repeat-containing protein [Myxococcota bacterium]|nr:right-handed parallel beta-helix repeat-containing protein [Myxococcota bacterium]
MFLWSAFWGCAQTVAPPPAAVGPAGAELRGKGRNLEGSHTVPVTRACTRVLQPEGRATEESLAQAVAHLNAGDVVCFAAGRYPPLRVDGVQGTADAPIAFRAVPGEEATFSSGSLAYGSAVSIFRSDHVQVYDLHLTHSQKGIELKSVSHARVEGLRIEDLGQEAIAVGALHSQDGSPHFLGPPSHHVDVIGNLLRDTGKVTARYGEGVYVGTGGFAGDETHDVLIAYNQMEQIRAEGVDLKAHSYNLIVRGNLIAHSSHRFHAAITAGVAPVQGRDGNYLIEDNHIFDYCSTDQPVAGIGIGHGNAVVRNNLIWNIPGGSGIQTYTTFGNPEARQVLLERNTIWNPEGRSLALDEGDQGTGARFSAEVRLEGNLLSDDPSPPPPPTPR